MSDRWQLCPAPGCLARCVPGEPTCRSTTDPHQLRWNTESFASWAAHPDSGAAAVSGTDNRSTHPTVRLDPQDLGPRRGDTQRLPVTPPQSGTGRDSRPAGRAGWVAAGVLLLCCFVLIGSLVGVYRNTTRTGPGATTVTFSATQPAAASGTSPSPSPTSSSPSSQAPVVVNEINAGGPAMGDWQADNGVMFPSATMALDDTISVDTSGVTDPAPEQVYQSERWGRFSYTATGLRPDHRYRIRLHFAEIYKPNDGPDRRLFDVTVNGTGWLSNYDIYTRAGGFAKAVVEQTTVDPTSEGSIQLDFTPHKDQAKVCGIEILDLGQR